MLTAYVIYILKKNSLTRKSLEAREMKAVFPFSLPDFVPTGRYGFRVPWVRNHGWLPDRLLENPRDVALPDMSTFLIFIKESATPSSSF